MNTKFKIKFLQSINYKKNNQGFTLIELLVVVIIIGVLAAIAVPNLLGQVAKGRQAEAVNNLGALNRAQTAYRLEYATFSNIENDLSIKINMLYYDLVFNPDATPSNLKESVSYWTKAKTTYQNDVLDYGAGVMMDANGALSQIICREIGLNSRRNLDPDFAFPSYTLNRIDCNSGRSIPLK